MITLDEVNALDQDTFVAALGGVFEGEPWIVRAAWHARPFASVDQLHRTLCAIMNAAPQERHVALLRAHPDLVGRAALAGTLGAASTHEQAAAGLNRLTPDEIATFQRLNVAYTQRFGFPFVICARENKKASILAGFAARLEHSREQEIGIALGEVAKIGALRLRDIVADTTIGANQDMSGDVIGEEETVSSERSSGVTHEISYGKLHVPVYRAYARPLTGLAPIPESAVTAVDNALFAVEVDVEVFGENFLPAYTQGDNSRVVATDSMKNIILRQALAWDGTTLESYLAETGRHLLETYPQIERLRVAGRRMPFAAALVPGDDSIFTPSDTLFRETRGDYAHASVAFERDAAGGAVLTSQRSGRAGMQLLKVTGSAFTRFVRDAYTTLPERGDRPLYIAIDVAWEYADPDDMLGADPARYVAADQVRDLVQVVFHQTVSESIQQLVHVMGTRLLERFPQLRSVAFEAQNRTPDPVGASEADPKVRVYTAAFPAHGLIRLTLTQSESE